MITHVAGNKADKRTVKITTDFKQGQWGYLNGNDSAGDEQVTPVSLQAHSQKNRHLLVLVGKETISKDKGDDSYETIYANDGGDNDDGLYPYMIIGAGHLIEDNKLSGRVSSTFNSSTVHGTEMVLTVSGYPTLNTAGDAPSGATTVAYFNTVLGDVVQYTTV